MIPQSCNYLLKPDPFRASMKFIPVDWDPEAWRKASERLFKEKATRVYVQAPARFQNLITHFIRGLSPWDRFLEEVAKRTGVADPEQDPRTGWVHAIKMARSLTAKATAIEPDPGKLLEAVEKKLTIKDRKPAIHEAHLWYLSREGFLRRFISLLDFPVKFLAPGFRIRWIRFWLMIYGALANILPGDQKDFVAAVAMADHLMAQRMAEALKDQEEGHVLVDRWYEDSVRKAYLELQA